MGAGRRRQGRKAASQPRPASPTRMVGGRRLDPGRHRRNPHRHAAWIAKELRRSLACTNIVENVMSTVRRVCRNVKRWRSASMSLCWTAAAMQEAAKGFRRLKAHKQLPALRAALEAHQMKSSAHGVLARQANAA